MSTHCTLGIRHPDGQITGCYVHYDGSTMEPRIHGFISKRTTTGLFTLIVKAQEAGGLRSFHSQGFNETEPTTNFLEDGEPYVIDEINFYDDHMGTGVWYLVDYNTGDIERTSKW